MKFSSIFLFLASALPANGQRLASSGAKGRLRNLSDEERNLAWDDASMSMSMSIAGVAGMDSDMSSKAGKSSKAASCGQFAGAQPANNGQNGNMFKIEAKNDIVIKGFTLFSIQSEVAPVSIWDKCGDYEGFDSVPEAWNLVQNVFVEGQGRDEEVLLPKLERPIYVPAGSVHSFKIYSGFGVRYTNGLNGEGSVQSENDDLTFFEGRGCSYIFNCPFTPRVWNGFIDYCVGTPDKSGKAAKGESNCQSVPVPPADEPSVPAFLGADNMADMADMKCGL